MTSEENAAGDSPKAHYGKVTDVRMSAEEMDMRRNENIAYEYLCHLEEAKIWIEACINEELPGTTELEEGLRNGVILAKLGHFMAPEKVALKKIYDRDESRYNTRGLHFRHTDNINHFLRAMEEVGHPKIFYPETLDIYDRKNMPRVIYCIHALSLYLFKLGKAPQIQDLYGKIKFTDEEISAMRKELEKYGIQMPAFSKIGGILATEMPVDEAALHAAVIAINEAIDKQEVPHTIEALQNPQAHLVNINTDLGQVYQDTMYEAKQNKMEIARNKYGRLITRPDTQYDQSLDPDSSYVPDVYDELLTQAEIQGNINKINTQYSLSVLYEALLKGDRTQVLAALRKPQLQLRDVKDENIDFYMHRLQEASDNKKNNNNEEESILTRDEIQMAIHAANLDADGEHQKMVALKTINNALNSDDPLATLKALGHPVFGLTLLGEYAAPLYHEELKNMRTEKEGDLEVDEVQQGTAVLTAIGRINQAIDAGDPTTLYSMLEQSDACISGLDDDCKAKYLQHLLEAKHDKSGSKCELLTHYDVQNAINEVNKLVIGENERIVALGLINEAIDSGDHTITLEKLQMPNAGLANVQPGNSKHYQKLLVSQKEWKAKQTDDPTAVLWYQEIQDTVNLCNQHAEEGHKMSVGVAAINLALDVPEQADLVSCLTNPDVGLRGVIPECGRMYKKRLTELKNKKMKAGEVGCGWMMNRTKEGHKFFFNVHTMEHSWERSNGIRKDHSLLTKEEIQKCISDVTAAHDRQLLFKANEKLVIKLQCQVKGYLARKKYKDKREFMYNQLPAIVTIQSWWRMILQRRQYQERLNYLRSQVEATLRLQACARKIIARKTYTKRLQYFKDNESAVVKIQTFVRSRWAVKDYRMLMHGENPPVSVVRKFVHLLDVGDIDYSEEIGACIINQNYCEEIELERLRQQCVQDIRTNNSLESDLNQMDIKIGLLVKNRITLQDVISQHKTLKKYKDSSSNLQKSGLKTLNKHSRETLEAYQNLFYLLQTNPTYLAKLIFEMPQNRSAKYMESVIYTLYNYGSNQREEYLLLKLFKTALDEEIKSKVDKMSDIVTGNPMVVKMIVTFNRNGRGQGSLRELLNPMVRSVLDNKALAINTNPVELYKKWVNQMESETGKASGLPYEVTLEEALKHPEVSALLRDSIKALQQSTESFLRAILSNVESIPYGMRYMAKVMKTALHEKFPEAPEKDILKIVGNLIYYRYINSAIVAPDAFDIVDIGANTGLTNDQRRNLGSIAKILQFAASNKGFGGDSAHLACMNSYIMDAHTRFKKYFRAVCDVEEPEVLFNMDQLTDLTRVTKPVIYISIGEMIETHKMLLEHQDTIAPDHTDRLHELLEDLGEVPQVDTLIGDVSGAEEGLNKALLAKTEISLTLSNKFEVIDDKESDMKAKMIRTKRMVVDVVRCQRSGENLVQILSIPATPSEEHEHRALVKTRDRIDQKALSKKAKLSRTPSLIGDSSLPLEEMKIKIKENLKDLEKAGIVSHRNNYQTLVNSIVQDIRNQRAYRVRRRQEMVRLKTALNSLSAKRAFFEEQINYYNAYVKTCLENLATKGKKSGRKYAKSGSEQKSKKAKGSIKYSAARLHEKGVVLEIEGLPSNQFKNVLFEISATETAGIFDVNAKFMGVNMEKVELVFQDLLQLQYEGVAVMKMFDRARINVNLLIFLINKKFYGK